MVHENIPRNWYVASLRVVSLPSVSEVTENEELNFGREKNTKRNHVSLSWVRLG